MRHLVWVVCLSMTFCVGESSLFAEDASTLGDSVELKVNWYSPEFWESVDGEPVEKTWEFDNDEIRLVNPHGGSGSIVSPPMPPNFELTWQWKISEKTNGGLKYRVRRFGNHMFGNAYLGLEYQIIDDSPESLSDGSTASIYDLFAPTQTKKKLHPPGEWNTSRVVASGDRLEHYLNGDLMASGIVSGPNWDLTMAMSKFYGATDFGKPAEGDRLMLTDHGGRATYKDFHLVKLDEPTSREQQPTSNGPFLANAMRNSWVDQNSIVLWTRTTARPEFVADGKQFVDIDNKRVKKLSESRDANEILKAQLPEGAKLDEMIGACPGATGQVRLTYFPSKNNNARKSTEWKTTSAEQDFTAQWKLDELKPDTVYAAVIEARNNDGSEPSAVVRGSFRTAPPVQESKDLTFCFTTCHDFIRSDDGLKGHKIYPSMTKIGPDFVVHAGDIEYYDKPLPWAMSKELMRFKWGRIFSLPNYRQFYNTTSTYFLKDDHDTLKNDCWAGERYGSVTFEEGVQIFNEEQFPTLSPRYKTVRWGKDLQLWFLEGRDYRSPNNMPDGPEKTILGAEQKAWLFETLKESEATFKIICSPTPVVGPDRGNKNDNHANDGFVHEGDVIREHLSSVENVIVLCGDRHWQYASVDEETKLWEFGCGPGSEEHELGWKEGDERPSHRFLRVKGGFLSGELKHDKSTTEPKLTIRHHQVTGEQVSEFVFPVVAQ